MKKIYLIIPTINGEINGNPYITLSLDYDFVGENTIYCIDLETLYVSEVDI